jgi:hypothetical protein
MKKYSVDVPISGFINVEVEAEDKKDAIDKAFESEDLKLDNIVEWEAHEHICEGNVCYAVLFDIDANELDDKDEEDGE